MLFIFQVYEVWKIKPLQSKHFSFNLRFQKLFSLIFFSVKQNTIFCPKLEFPSLIQVPQSCCERPCWLHKPVNHNCLTPFGRGSRLRWTTKPVCQSNICVHGWMSWGRCWKQEWRAGFNQTGFGLQKAINPFFQAGVMASQPLRLQLLHLT